jgi:hypothetical protein
VLISSWILHYNPYPRISLDYHAHSLLLPGEPFSGIYTLREFVCIRQAFRTEAGSQFRALGEEAAQN